MRPAVAGNEPGLLEHLEVAGDGRLRDAEGRGQLGDRGVTLGQPGQDGAAGGIGEGAEDDAELITETLHNHLVP